jgi:hypothetical protein
VVLILGLVVAGMVCLLLLNTAVNQNSFQLHALQSSQKSLDIQEQGLRQDVDQLQAPGSLAAAARRLGLVPAGQPAFIRLPDGHILGVPTPAKSPSSSSTDTSDGTQPLVPPANPPANSTANSSSNSSSNNGAATPGNSQNGAAAGTTGGATGGTPGGAR